MMYENLCCWKISGFNNYKMYFKIREETEIIFET